MTDEEMIEKMHAVYAKTQVDSDIPTAGSRMDTFIEGKMKITNRQLRRIIREAMADEPIRMIPGDSFDAGTMKKHHTKRASGPEFKDTIVMSPTGDTILVGGQEVALQNAAKELEIQSGQPISAMQAGDINAKLSRQYGQGYVELPISWSSSTGWQF